MSTTHAPAPVPTTRDLLAEIASREPHEPQSAEHERGERRFVRWLFAIIILLIVVLYAILWWLDPISVTGRQTRFSVVENGGVRQAKLDLMENLKQPPQVMILGSSRSMKLDPRMITKLTGQRAFNGGVSGGTSKDAYLYARYAEQLWAGTDKTKAQFPHLVIGLMNDVLRNDSTAAFDPRLRRFLPSSQQRPSRLDTAKALLQWKTINAAQHAVRTVVPRDGIKSLLDPEGHSGAESADLAVEGAQRGNQKKNFTPEGFQLFDPVLNMKAPLHKRVSAQMTVYVRNSYSGPPYSGADPIGISFLKRTIQLANKHGDVPTIWKTPFQPWGKAHFLHKAYYKRDAHFEAVMQQLEHDPTLKFHYDNGFDNLAYFGGDPNQFYDGIHEEPYNTNLVLKKLNALGLLAKKPAAGAASS